jgi:magnesium transporter
MIRRFEKQGLVWVDLESPTTEEIESVTQEFKLDPRIQFEILSSTPRPRAERYGNHLYIVLHFPVWKHSHQLSPHQEIDFVLGKKFLITTHYETIDAIHKFMKQFEVEVILDREDDIDAVSLFAGLLAKLYRSVSYELQHLHETIQEIERKIFAGQEKAMVLNLSRVSREILSFKRALSLHDEIIEGAKIIGESVFGSKLVDYLRGVLQEHLRITDSLNATMDEFRELRFTNDSLLSTKQSEFLRKLAVLTFLGLPATVIFALFGTNAQFAPLIGFEGDFWAITVLALLATLALFITIRINRWL